MRVVPAACLAVLLGTSCSNGPKQDFDDFLHRADRSQRDGGAGAPSHYEELSGTWLVNSLLAGGINLALRMRFTVDAGPPPVHAHVSIWLARPDGDPTPYSASALEIDTMIDADGKFILRADPLILGPNELPVNTTVKAIVVMDSRTLGKDEWCGSATGSVDEPLVLDLAGTTFSARRDEGDMLLRKDVPQRCPGAGPAPMRPDAGAADAGRPMSPDLSRVPSHLADLSGHWILSSRLAGALPLQLWASLAYVPAGPGAGGAGGAGAGGAGGAGPIGGGSLDGALRRAVDPPGTPALVTFTTRVDADGRFEVWVPSLELPTAGGDVIKGRILLGGATLSADAFCGVGVGDVSSPIELDLQGTTFHAVRWTPGTPVPMAATDRCP